RFVARASLGAGMAFGRRGDPPHQRGILAGILRALEQGGRFQRFRPALVAGVRLGEQRRGDERVGIGVQRQQIDLVVAELRDLLLRRHFRRDDRRWRRRTQGLGRRERRQQRERTAEKYTTQHPVLLARTKRPV